MEYVMKKRMAQAEKLLRETDQSVKEIALFCGFSDVEYFSRCFKKEHGCPPGGKLKFHMQHGSQKEERNCKKSKPEENYRHTGTEGLRGTSVQSTFLTF